MSAVARLIRAVATLVVRRRRIPLVALALLTLAAAAAIPRIEADPSPEGLVSKYGDQEETSARLRSLSGDTDRVVVLLVRARDVLARAPLSYVHELSQHFREVPFVDRVESLTVTPIARRAVGDDEELTLDELEADTVDGGGDAPSPEVLNALDALVRAEPERFPGGIAQLSDATASIEDGPPVGPEGVTEEATEELRRALEDAPLVEGRLVSRDRTSTAVVIRLSDDVAEWDALTRSVDEVDEWIAAHPPPEGVELITGGLPHLRTAIVDKMITDQTVLVPLTLLTCVVLLFASFRWWPATLLPNVAVAMTAILVVGTMAAVGEPMNILNNIVPALLIIIGISDSIHLINRYREELRHTNDRKTAAFATVRSMSVACFLTSATTAVGLGSLVVSQTELLRRFAVVSALGVLLAYVVTVAFLPAALTVFRPPKVEPDETALSGGWLERVAVRAAAAVIRRPWPVLFATAALLAASAWVGSRIEVDTRLLDQFDERDEVYHATRLMDAELDGVRPLEVLLASDQAGRFTDPELLAVVDEAAAWSEAREGVLRASSVPTYLKEVWYLLTEDPTARTAPLQSREQVDALVTLLDQRDPDPLDGYLSSDGRLLRLEVRMQDVGAQRTIAFIDELRERLRERLPSDVSVTMTGEAYTGSVAVASVVDDLLGSLATAVVVIFAMLALLFRSLRLGLLSIPPNVIPLVCTLGWMVLRGISLNIATAIIFSVSLGLAVDGTIHVLARFREERASGRDVDAALLQAAGGTGRAIVVSSVTLMIGFAVLLLSEFVPVRHFGELIAVTVAGCLVSTLLVQPALLKLGAK